MACTFWAGEVRLLRAPASGPARFGYCERPLLSRCGSASTNACERSLLSRRGLAIAMTWEGPAYVRALYFVRIMPRCLAFAVRLMWRRDRKSLKCKSEQPNGLRASRRSICVCKPAGRSIDVPWATLAGLIWLLTFGIPSFLGVCLSALMRVNWEGRGSRLYPSSYP